jgi:hypothetical protein
MVIGCSQASKLEVKVRNEKEGKEMQEGIIKTKGHVPHSLSSGVRNLCQYTTMLNPTLFFFCEPPNFYSFDPGSFSIIYIFN